MRTPLRSAALVGAAALVLAACGTTPEEEAESTQDATATEAAAEQVDFKACMVSDEGGFDDQSFNQSGAEGLERAEAELGVQTNLVESNDAAEYGPNIEALIQDECGIIFTVGFAMGSATVDAALANPDQNFGIVDDTPDGDPSTEDFEPPPPNVKPLVYDTAQAAYLAGYVAAGMTETGIVATFGGRPFPTVTIFMDGFAKGVEKHNEEKGTSVQVLGWTGNADTSSFTGDFTDENKGKQLSQNFIQQGADIVLPVAGPVGKGTLAAASEADGVKVIWVDSDGFLTVPEFGQYILTSVLKQIGGATFATTEEALNDEFDPSQYIGTLENGGVGIAPFHDFEDAVPDELKTEIEDLQQQIIDGTIDIGSEFSPQPS